ncbi:hypothetical protein [Pseudomonas alloputida]|uniref:hypothetical protein n=1 Tax=Pseudomonas TaxID=286 RepID=UPI003EEF6A50
MAFQWGILGPGAVQSTRRTRTLGLAASTRLFNELAVPGLGGVWFGKQLLLPTLGVLVAQRAQAQGQRVSKIAVANAIEALACWLAINGGDSAADGRVKGRTKLAGRTLADFTFANASRPGFYVTQPMRMATVAALPALGLVEASGSRFNSYTSSDAGVKLIELATRDLRPHNRDLTDHLLRWVCGNEGSMGSHTLKRALSPQEPLPGSARTFLLERLCQGASGRPGWERQRRSDALAWVRSHGLDAQPQDWDKQPTQIQDAEHWSDMRAGARFFAARDAAYTVLDEVEAFLATPDARFNLGSPLPTNIQACMAELRAKAQAFLELRHADEEATTFCREVVGEAQDEVLQRLVGRDGRVLKMVGRQVCAGPAFQPGSQVNADTESDLDEVPAPASTEPVWPENISGRIRNLWWLNQDLTGFESSGLQEVAYG